jgi:hypothetical protein
MNSSPDHTASKRLRHAIVLSTTEDACTVFADGQQAVVPYAPFFPEPRSERVAPGHLVALAATADGSEVVVWRWFDAVVLGTDGGSVSFWEPGHGSVIAEPRDARSTYRPGSRAYISAGLPGAAWWVAGLAVDRAEDAQVDLDEVDRFLTSLGVWDDVTHQGA